MLLPNTILCPVVQGDKRQPGGAGDVPAVVRLVRVQPGQRRVDRRLHERGDGESDCRGHDIGGRHRWRLRDAAKLRCYQVRGGCMWCRRGWVQDGQAPTTCLSPNMLSTKARPSVESACAHVCVSV